MKAAFTACFINGRLRYKDRVSSSEKMKKNSFIFFLLLPHKDKPRLTFCAFTMYPMTFYILTRVQGRSPSSRGNNFTSCSILNVDNVEAGRRVVGTKLMRARRLVADINIEMAYLVIAIFADGVKQVNQLVVASDPATLIFKAAGNKIDTVGCSELQRAILKKRFAFVWVDKLIVHGEASALVRLVPSRDSKDEIVPGVV